MLGGINYAILAKSTKIIPTGWQRACNLRANFTNIQRAGNGLETGWNLNEAISNIKVLIIGRNFIKWAGSVLEVVFYEKNANCNVKSMRVGPGVNFQKIRQI